MIRKLSLLTILCLFVLMLLCQSTAFCITCGDYQYQLVDSHAIITAYTGDTCQITVPCEVDGYAVIGIGEHAFEWHRSITAIILPEGLTDIGLRAFSSCKDLTAITLPESLAAIGDFAFVDCVSLTEIALPEGLSSISPDAFFLSDELTLIVIPDSYAHQWAVTQDLPYRFPEITSSEQ